MIPLIKVKDKATNTEHIVGSDIHDSLFIDDNGHITYRNMQNGEGTGENSDYEFDSVDNSFEGEEIDFVDIEEYLKLINYDTSSEGKAKAKKVVIKHKLLGFYPCCPNCGATFFTQYGKTNYCGNCGQKLNWDSFQEELKQVNQMFK